MLRLFTLAAPEWGITEMATHLGWSTSTTHDLASSLATIGLLKKSGKRRYTVGWRVLELSQVVLGSSTLQTSARKEMEAFSSRYDETILLAVLAGGKVLFADKIFSKSADPALYLTTDGRFPAHCTATGKVLLAHLAEGERQAVFQEHRFEPMTPKSIQSLGMLHEELTRIKAEGHAYAFEEMVIGMGSVAAPIFDFSGRVVAACSIAADIRRFERHLDRYRNEIVRVAKQISGRLGHFFG